MDYNALNRKVHELYMQGQKEAGFEIGDIVKVTTSARSYDNGWREMWCEAMDADVGQERQIVDINDRGICLSDGGRTFPYWVLKKVEKPVEKKERPCEFMPYDKVLVRDFDSRMWRIDIYAYAEMHNHGVVHICIGGAWSQCIHYEGNEHLYRTTESPKK